MEKPSSNNKKKERLTNLTSRKAREFKRYGKGLLKGILVATVLESCGESTPTLLKDYVAAHPTVESMAQDQKSWLESYIQSGMYKTRLTGEVEEYSQEVDLGGKTVQEVVDFIINERLNNLATCRLVVGTIKDDEGKEVVGEYIPGSEHHVIFGEGANITTPVHELTHATTRSSIGMLPSTNRAFVNLIDPKLDVSRLGNEEYGVLDYGYRPYENAARVNEIRFALEKAGVYLAKEEDFTYKEYFFLKENIHKLFPKGSPIQEMLLIVPPGGFIKMMNKFATVDGPSTVPNIFNIDVGFERSA